MTSEEFKKLLEEAFSSIKEDLNGVKEELSKVKQTQAEHTELFENRVLPPLTEIETTVKSYKDAYQTNKANIERLDTRVIGLEENAGIVVSPDFAIHR